MDEEKKLVRCLRQGLILWQDFKKDGRALYIGDESSPIAEALELAGLHVEAVTLDASVDDEWVSAHEDAFDCIVSIADIERVTSPETYILAWRKMLTRDGKLLLGMNNRLGLKYFCGDRDPHTMRSFDGVENYRLVYANPKDTFNGRMYSRGELGQMVARAGFDKVKFYAVLPDLMNPMLIYADDEKPLESLSTRLFPTYNHPESVFLEEQYLYDTLVDEGLFHEMANAYLIECAKGDTLSDVVHVTSSLERGRVNGFLTIIHERSEHDGKRTVEKRAPYAEGLTHIRELEENTEALKAHGIKVIDGKLDGSRYTMPFITEEVGELRLKRLFREDREAFLRELDHFRDLILQSSEHEAEDSGNGDGVILKRGYYDMVPLNSFYIDGEYVFYDHEFSIQHYPANVMIMRTVDLAYDTTDGKLCMEYPRERLYERYNLNKRLADWQRMDAEFLSSFRMDNVLRAYHQKCRADYGALNLQRQRINFSDDEHEKYFRDIFPKDGRPIVVFGSGNWAKKFMTFYGRHLNVTAIVDNNKEAWGKAIEGIEVESADALTKMETGSFRLIICIKNYLSVLHQIADMSIDDYRIYDGNESYVLPDAARLSDNPNDEADAPKRKKYKVGYIAGVFDLIHIGHLNMFRRAKEQCDYLIVGVVSDKQVRLGKKVEPFVPFEERIEMVRAIRYVDEAHEIPFEYSGTIEAWQMYHFDVQFSGSDYINDPGWLSWRDFLRRHGSELVFFPYTQQTSSTKIKALINKKLV